MIKPQQQPTFDTCASACLAMITGIDVQEVIDEFHADYFAGKKRPSDYLLEHGYHFRMGTDEELGLFKDRLYLLTVPSLNIEAGLHFVVADTRPSKTHIHDPARTMPGKKFYRTNFGSDEPLNEYEVELSGYVISLEIIV